MPDHHRLLPRLFARLAPGGRIVTQLPSNDDSVAHDALVALADEEPFRSAMAKRVEDWPTLSAAAYAQLLWSVDELPDADAVVEWMKGTTVVPYLERLPRAQHAPFLQRYTSALRVAMPDKPLFFGFKRTLFAASSAA